MFMFRKNKELLAKLDNYFKILTETMEIFAEAVRHVRVNGIDGHFEVLAERMHQSEHNADELRRAMEMEMYEKSLLAEFQSDFLQIIELIDRIASKGEHILYMLLLQRTEIHPCLKSDVDELVKVSIDAYRNTVEAAVNAFGDMRKVHELSRLVDNSERLGDGLERKMIKELFLEEMDTGEKILQKEVVKELGSICDLCQEATDNIVICVAKRRV